MEAELGERLKTRWEWAAVLGQVEIFAWDTLNLRSARPPACGAWDRGCTDERGADEVTTRRLNKIGRADDQMIQQVITASNG
jgi:hypothetical protein